MPADAIFYDPYSPAVNPEMWTVSAFEAVRSALDPQRPCSLATYSRSTMTRAALFAAGFYVGAGEPTGFKEETTVAANAMELIERPLGREWLERVQRSGSAEPLWEPRYTQAPITPGTLERLKQHAQFRG